MFYSRWLDNLVKVAHSRKDRRRPASRRRSPNRRIVPLLETLEERVTPTGSIAFTGISEVDQYGNPLTSINAGQQVYIQANFNTTNLPSNASYQIAFDVNGLTLKSNSLNYNDGVSGTTVAYEYWGPFIATPGTNQVSVSVNSSSGISSDTMSTTFDATMPQVPGSYYSYTAAQIRDAYGINNIPNFGSAAADGSGQTIAIVDDYNDPTIYSDLDTFDQIMSLSLNSTQNIYQQYGAASSFLTVYNQNGQNISSNIASSGSNGVPNVDPTGSWEGEETMDVEWAHALAPGAKIDLIECDGNGPTGGLFTGATTAGQLPGVSAVSMSWIFDEGFPGVSDASGESYYDSHTFVTPSGHTGITFLASSGDAGTPGGYPALSPNVVAVGGTQLSLNNNTYDSESAWSFPTPRTLDNGSSSYSQTGSWTSQAGGFSGSYSTAAGGSNSSATWTTSLTNADYGWAGGVDVSTTWVPNANNATNAQYQIYDGTVASGNLLGTVTVDQTKAPVGISDGSSQFQDLGTYFPSSGQLTVVLSANSANGTVVADAVGIAPAWATSGGPSQYEPEPSYQLPYQNTGQRTSPDVSFDGGAYSGVTCVQDGGVYFDYYGTSLSSPCWAGLIAIVNQGRVADGLPTLNSTANPMQTLQALYSLPASDFHDITTGYNGYSATSGYDFLTGRGTPIANLLVPDLVNYAATTVIKANSAATVTYSTSTQYVTLSATVTSSDLTVDEGKVKFTLVNSTGATIGTAVSTSVTSNGGASVQYGLPAFTNVGSYTIEASYSGTPGTFAASTNATQSPAATLSVDPASTSITAKSTSTTFSTSAQKVTLNATVSSSGNTVDEGKVKFTVVNGTGKTIGSAVSTSVTSNGGASVQYGLPLYTLVGSYTIEASYSDSKGNFSASTNATQSPPATLSVTAAATLTTADNTKTPFSTSSQYVTLSARVISAAGPVNEGNVTFTIMSGNTVIGTATTSTTVSNGQASVSYLVPAGLAATTFTIDASYSDNGGNFQASTNANQSPTPLLTVLGVPTTITASSVTTTFSTSSQSVTLTAQVSSNGTPVNGGTVTFALLQGTTVIGTATTSGTVRNGQVSVSYNLPANLAAGRYTIDAVYNPGFGLAASSDVNQLPLPILTVVPAATTTTTSNATVRSSPGPQTITLTAQVSSAAGPVNEGSVTFTILQGNTVIGTATTSLVHNGQATVSYVLPANLPVGLYTIEAVYNPGGDFRGSSDLRHMLFVSPM